ncbi:unnamed protein product [Prorocentrum cordatum]|uniref:RNA-directed RNA polymerase n=1 Tax=Prorocentrum cordatum TaxID=2364126 RepID=A0ABN9RK82_9DINO|nr:unnamed protein product [Polarella glacialis]
MARVGDYILLIYDLPGSPVYHERLLTGVSLGDPGLISAYSPDGNHYAEHTTSDDLADVRWSGAQGATPPGVNPARVYRFRQVPTAAEVQQLIREGSLLIGGVAPAAAAGAAAVVPAAPVAAQGGSPAAAPAPRGPGLAGGVPRAGAAAAPAPAGTVWLVAEDHRGLRRGERLPDPLPAGSTTHGDVALVPHGGVIVAARQVPVAEVDAFVVGDLRVLPVRFNQEGARRRPFSEAVGLQVSDEPEGGVMLSGPRACSWVLRSWRDAGLTLITHRANWLRSSRIPDGDRSVHEHGVLARVLDSLVTVDQLKAPALQSAELICRRIQLILDAHSVSPSNPDYSAADDCMGWATHRQGAAVAPDLQRHVATAMHGRAAILKEARKAKEEQKLRRGKGGGKTDAGVAGGGRPATDNMPGQALLSLQKPTPPTLSSVSSSDAIAGLDALRPPCEQRGPITAAQRLATATILSEVRMAPKSDTHFSRRGAAKELLASSLSCTADEAPSPVVRCVGSRVDILDVGEVAPPVESVLDEIGKSYLLDYEQTMMKTPDEWPRVLDSEPPVTPYMGEVLKRDPAAYNTFTGDLVRANMPGFMCRPKYLFSPFFVAKKSGAQRLVWGTRAPNRRFRDPPPLAMGTSAAHGRLRLPDDRDEAGGYRAEPFCAQADVRNYFYALGLREELGLFFALPPVSQASLSQWRVEAVGSPEGPSGGWVWSFLRVVPMGWSWAFWLGQRASAHVCCSVSGLGVPRVLTDRGPVPPLGGGPPRLLPHCDDINVIGMDPVRCSSTMHLICDAWRKHGLEIHEVVEASDVFSGLGRLIDGCSGLASLWLEQRPGVAGREVERYVGYLIDHLMFRRELLSILRSLCDFFRDCCHVRARLWPSAAREVEQRRRLLPLMSANLRLQSSPTVLAYDACLTSMAACQTTLSSHLVKSIGSVSERWGYRMPSAITARRSALGVGAAGVGEASEGPRDVFTDAEAVKAPRLTDEDHVEDPWELNPQFTEVPREALQGPKLKQVVSTRVHVKEAIAIVEGRASKMTSRHIMRARGSCGLRHLRFGDNLGTVLALGRGRCSSCPLLLCCRREAACPVAAASRFEHRWMPSEFNPADEGSRRWGAKSGGVAPAPRGGQAPGGQPQDSPEESFLKGRPFVGARKEERAAHRLLASGPFAIVREDERSLLECNAMTPETQACYRKVVDELHVFVDPHALPLQTAAQVDQALTSYADYAWSTGLERAVVLKTYAACISARPDFPRRGSLRLPRFCRVLQGWKRLGPGQTRAPMPWQTVALVALVMAAQLAAPRAALMVDAMFWAYLGPSEAVGLREQGRFLSGGSSKDYGFNLRPSAWGECSKTSLSDESLLLDSAEVPWLGPLLARARSGGPLAQLFGLAALGRRALELAGAPTKCAPCQLRRGGPSLDRLMRPPPRGGDQGPRALGQRLRDEEQELAPLSADVRRRAEAAPRKLRAELERLHAPPRAFFKGAPARARAKPIVELTCGSADLAKAVYAAGWAAEGWGYADGPGADLLGDGLVDRLVIEDLSKGCRWGSRRPGKAWSRARKNDGMGPPPLRDDVRAYGLEHLAAADAEKVSVANRLLANVLRLLVAAVEAAVPASLENPLSSRLWLVPEMLDLARAAKADWAQVLFELVVAKAKIL